MTDPENGLHFSFVQTRHVNKTSEGDFEITKEALTLEEIVDADIAEFAEYFCGELGNDSLAKPERSIIKTYLWWKIHKENPSGET